MLDQRIIRLLNQLRVELVTLTPEDRLSVFEIISEGYCEHCGFELSKYNSACTCMNDE